MITDVRARARVRRHYHGRSGVGPSAILGMFGAVMGAAALANSYDNYSNYSYGGLNNYGYSPGYGGGGGYAGRGGFGGGRGGHAGGGGHAAEAVVAIVEAPDQWRRGAGIVSSAEM